MKCLKEEFEYAQCSVENIDEICALQDEAFCSMSDDTMLRRNSSETLLSCLREPHFTLGAFHNGVLAGFAVMFVPGLSDENIALSAGFSESEAAETVNFKLVIVKPDYRGNGLQKEFILRLDALAKEKGYKKIFATVAPNNEYSKNNFLNSGYEFHSQKVKYGGLVRNIYYKNL